MERRGWPWKKKPSDRYTVEKAIAPLDSGGASLAEGSQNQNATDTYRKPSYVQISVESYTHMSDLEDQVIAYEEEVKVYRDQLKSLDMQIEDLNKKLSDANSEMTNKEELVEQHAKVAEEAVSGWEKAEAEAATLKTHLEAVTLEKLTVEGRAAQLDSALKECMRQIRDLKEEHERKVQDVILTKNKQYDKMKLEFESKISAYDQELRKAQAENNALSRSLQERSNMLIKINEERSQAEAEIELRKNNIESCEREINSLKYELHIVSKELEIRNEEKHMSVKSAEVANKQQIESVKKIAKLEAECQRLRSLVRKKLPGPAALAQMKMEVEYHSYGESRFRKTNSADSSQKLQKENEFLTKRLFSLEEETKMLKEALARRNSELQGSRSKIQSLEVQLTSMSEDGNDDIISAAESCGSSDKKKDKTNRLDLMDDFLEMEKLASLNQPEVKSEFILKKEIVSAITEIHSFILSLLEPAAGFHGESEGLNSKIEQFTALINEVVQNETSLGDFILALSEVAVKASDLRFKFVGFKNSESEPNTPDCIDKVALPENKESQGERFSNISDSCSNPEDPSPSSDGVSYKCLMESIEELKVEKDSLVEELNKSMEDMEKMKLQLGETEQILEEVKSELVSSKNTNCLAETQLKCMAESYKSLEKRAEELENEINRLEIELESEKVSHENSLIRYKDLEEQLQRSKDCSVCASMAADLENKNKQEKELASAAEKLAECQETILQLGKQLKAMRPHDKEVIEEESAISGVSSRDSHQAEADTASSSNSHKLGAESPLYFYNNPSSPSNTDIHGYPRSPLPSNHIVSMPGSSSSSSTHATEKHSRGFTRFFSSSKSSSRH